MAYSQRTKWPGILAQHAGHCRARDGEDCTCGPLGYRASVEDPESGEPVLSPMFETQAEARAWRYEQREAFDAWTAASDERPTVDGIIEELLAAAARGSARDPYGRRFDAEGLRALRWALTGHVHEEIGSMPIAEVRTRHVQALVDRLDASGLSQRRVDGVVHALRALFTYAKERQLVPASPADALALPNKEFGPVSPYTTAAAPALAAPSPPQPPPPPPAPTVSVAAPAPTVVRAPVNVEQFSAITEQVIWTALKAATLMCVLIALVLVAESV